MRHITFVSTLLFVISFSLGSVNSYPDEPSCKKIAYVIDSKHRDFYPGQPICRGQIIPASAKVVIGCISVNNHFLIKDMMQLKECEADTVFPVRAIEKNRARGDSANSLALLSPSGKYLIQQKHVKFVWLPIKGARKYTLKVISEDSRSENVTKNNSMSASLPNSSSTFSVILKAYSDIRQIDSIVYKFIVLPENTHQLVSGYLKKIDDLFVPEQTKINLKLSVLKEYNLLEKSVAFLDAQILKNPEDFEGHFALGDIQFSQGLFLEANRSYLVSNKFARKNNNQIFITLSNLKLKFIRKYLIDNELEYKLR
jgi:hypothetical protein